MRKINMDSRFIIHKNTWDTEFFKKKIGNLEYSGGPKLSLKILKELLAETLREAKKQGYEYLVFTDTNGLKNIKDVINKNGFALCDSCVDFKMCLTAEKIKELDDWMVDGPMVKFARTSHLQYLKEISEKAFIRSRLYKIDFVRKKEIDKYHFIWVKNLFQGDNSKVLVIKDKSRIMGFLALTMDLKDKSSRINLIATRAAARGKGYGSILMKTYFKYVFEKGIRTLFVKTQKENTGARNFYLKNGYSEFCFEEKFHIYL